MDELRKFIQQEKPDLYYLYGHPNLLELQDVIKKVRESRPIIWTDLDQTLLDAYRYSGNYSNYCLDDHCEGCDNCYDRIKIFMKLLASRNLDYLEGIDHVFFLRTGLTMFLDWLYMNFDVCVLTKASPIYANFVINSILDTEDRMKNSGNHIKSIATQIDCDYINKTYYGRYDETDETNDKLLSYFQPLYPDRKYILIDNRLEVEQGNEGSYINVYDFDALDDNSWSGDELNRVQEILSDILRPWN